MRHDPIYDADNLERWELWVFRIIALVILALALGLVFAGVVKLSQDTTGEATPTPAESPPPALQETRTQVETGRMICEKTGEHGCVEWRIYRTTSY